MRRLTFLLIAALIAVAVVPVLGIGSLGPAAAQSAPDAVREPLDAPRFRVPAALPRELASHPGAYAFRPLKAIENALRAKEARAAATAKKTAAAQTSTTSASATIEITALILPVHTIVIDTENTIVEIWSNTDDPTGTDSLYQVRRGSLDGDAVALTRELWADARAAMHGRPAAVGRIV
jgi:hypothetical protein